MKQVEFTRNIRLYSHNIELSITGISNNCQIYELGNKLLEFKIMDAVAKQLKMGKTSGEFRAGTRTGNAPGVKSKTIHVKGTWRIRMDYNLFYRIVRWWYNCNFDPEKIGSLFTKAFKHNAETCLEQFEETYSRNIFDFTGFIGDNYEYGNAFMDIIAREMEAYEKKYSLPVQ